MNFLKTIKALFNEKAGKKVFLFSTIIFLLCTAFVFYTIFTIRRRTFLDVVNSQLNEIPNIFEKRREELRIQSHVYDDDILTRAEIGLKIFEEENQSTELQKLERVRDKISAESVSLLDEQGQVRATTGFVIPETRLSEVIRSIKPRSPHLEIYPVSPEGSNESEPNDGKGFVMIPISGDAGQNLLFEFECEIVVGLYNQLTDWAEILEETLTGEYSYAFSKTGEMLRGHPMEGLTDAQTKQLTGELEQLFQEKEKIEKAENGRLVRLLKKMQLATMMNYAEENTDVLLTVSPQIVFSNGFFIALAISAIIGCGLILIQLYIFFFILREKVKKGKRVSYPAALRGVKWYCLLIVLIVTSAFSFMLLMLEDRTNGTYIAVNRLATAQLTIKNAQSDETEIRNALVNFYRARAEILTDFLMEHPNYRTADGLKELNRIARTEYLMLFDRAGKEIVASNTYSGFSVEKNLNEKYQSVVMGYPNAVVGPEADPYTGQMQIGTAILMKDAEGKPDGFLLAVYNGAELKAYIERCNYENVINNYTVQRGHILAAIRDEDGHFIAHTNEEMIGQIATEYLEEVTPGNNYEGSALYGGKRVCVSAQTSDGKTLLYMVPENEISTARKNTIVLTLFMLLILGVFYYPVVCRLTLQIIENTKRALPDVIDKPLKIFYDGYLSFLAAFVLISMGMSYSGFWTPFDYVFTGEWAKGVNLFSLWMTLFVVTFVLFIRYIISTVLIRVERGQNGRPKTTVQILRSLINYMLGIILLFTILDTLGVNTTTMLASAGIISIAVGMGAQSMAADLIAGVFMVVENSVRIGDEITIPGAQGFSGRVTNMGIRTTELTDADGNVAVFNNSKITGVRNMGRRKKEENEAQETKKS